MAEVEEHVQPSISALISEAVEQSAPATVSESRVPVKLADFWLEEPDLWFVQTEAQFRRGHVFSTRAKADYLLAALQPTTLKSVRDVLADVTADDTTLYARLKERLLRRFAATKWSLAFQVLGHPGLGDLRPSQLLDSMMALLPAGEPAGVLFQALFLQRLPADMRDHLVAGDFHSPRDMAAVADRMWDSRSERPAVVSAVRGSSPASTRNRRRSPARRREPTPAGLCFFHGRFGVKAHKCEPPCTWTGPAPAGNVSAAGGN